jgi:hypothetical protein
MNKHDLKVVPHALIFIYATLSRTPDVLLKTIVDPNPEYSCKNLTKEATGLLVDVLEKGKMS